MEKLLQAILAIFLKEFGEQIHQKDLMQTVNSDLSAIWCYRLEKIFILELQQAKNAGLLEGKTPEQRYVFFTQAISEEKNQKNLLEKLYPVLVPQLDVFAKNYLNFFSEFCYRLKKDIKVLSMTFSIALEDHMLTSIKFLGDPHNYFRRVAVISFTSPSNESFKLVYKPRPIKNEFVFNEFIDWFNLHSSISIKMVRCLNRDQYGWCEFIDQKSCTSYQQIEGFYYRFGMLVAIAYLLGITDIHGENLIACGENPVIIDLECFGFELSDLTMAQNHFVLDSGMLPNYIIERNAAVDISAFSGGGPECEVPFENSYVKNSGRDDMFIARKSGFFALQPNRPTFDQHSVTPSDYKTTLLKGFEEAYSIVLKNKHICLRKFSNIFKKISSRIIFRPTSVYLKLIIESYHPFLLSSQKKYKNHLNWLGKNFSEKQLPQKVIAKILRSELEQIAQQDVPAFLLTGNAIVDAFGKNIFPRLKKTVDTIIGERIKNLTSQDLQKQKKLIEKTINTYEINYLSHRQKLSESFDNQASFLDKQHNEILKKVHCLLNTLLADCINPKEWLWPEHKEVHIKSKHYWILHYKNTFSLYSGSLGILFILVFICKYLPNKKYISWFNGGLDFFQRWVRERLVEKKETILDISMFSGIGGILYVLFHSAMLYPKNIKITRLIEHTLMLIEKNLYLWLNTYQFDIISGIAGLILVLDLFVKNKLQERRVSQIIQRCKIFLIKHYPQPNKLSKKACNQQTQKAVVGFSHGVSGIAYALYKTENLANPNKKIIHWIKRALEYERQNFNLEFQGWPNSITEQKKETKKETWFQTDWCHGALGIGLSRLALKKLGWKDKIIDLEIAISILALKASESKKQFNLCHGTLGVLDYYIHLHEKKLISSACFENKKKTWLDEILNTKSFITEYHPKIYIPGLMTGQTGIIYEILRILYPKSIPSILLIE